MNTLYGKYRYEELKQRLSQMGAYPLDVLIVGATGAGKSTTLNSLFMGEIAQVGWGSDPMTMQVKTYPLSDVLHLWDTPGFGDGVREDGEHQKKLQRAFADTYEQNGRRYGRVDLVLVILDGSSRDLGTAYRLLTDTVLKYFPAERVLVAINQADMAMKGRHWDEKINAPDEVLEQYLKEQAISVGHRIREATGIHVPGPVYFSAERGYHIRELLDLIINNVPKERRNISDCYRIARTV